MKKLYENIESIEIRGDISELTEMVKTIDISMQNIADISDRLVVSLSKYSSSNKGKQYGKVINTATKLRDLLYDSSLELNEMQKQIVRYQNKVYMYEDMSSRAQSPNQFLPNKRRISTESGIVKFEKTEMMMVSSALKNYSEKVNHYIRIVKEKKDAIGNIWRDRQYKDFSEFINNLTVEIRNGIKVYDEYTLLLDNKIKELS